MSRKKTCSGVLTGTIFIIAPTQSWKQPRCPPAEKLINKLCCYYNMDESYRHYIEQKKTQKNTNYMIPFIWRTTIDKSVPEGEKNEVCVLRGNRSGKRYKGTFWGIWNVTVW